MRPPIEQPRGQPRSGDVEHIRQQREFRTNLALTAFVHLVVLLGFFLAARFQPKPKVEQIMWLDGGLAGGGAPATSAPLPAPEPDPEPEPEVIPDPPKPEPAPTPPPQPSAPSEIVEPKPKATPPPTPVPTPKPATPKPATPKPATPKPKATPRATPKATPAKAASPKPQASPARTTPKPETDGGAKASPAPVKSEGNAAAEKASTGKTKGAGSNDTTGEGKGKGTAGSGTGAGKPSDFGWYFSLLRDKFYAVWSPPTVPDGASLVVRLKIRVKRDGTVLGSELVKSSGNSLMDGSVLEAARQVTQIDPLPNGLGKGDVIEIPVDFQPE